LLQNFNTLVRLSPGRAM